MVMRPRVRGTSLRPSTTAPPAAADCLKPPLKSATTPARPSDAQSTAGPASAGAWAQRLGSLEPTCQRSSVVRACRRRARNVTAPTTTLRKSTMTPRDDELATVQPGWGRSGGVVVVVVDVVVELDVVVVPAVFVSTTPVVAPTMSRVMRPYGTTRRKPRGRSGFTCD